MYYVRRFSRSRPRSRDYLKTGASDVSAGMWRRCRRNVGGRQADHTDTARFIAVSADDDQQRDLADDDDDDDETSLRPAADDNSQLSQQFDALHAVVVKVWLFVDVLLVVRRLSLIIFAARRLHCIHTHYDAVMTSRGSVTWPPTVDQSQQPLAVRQNGDGPYCLPPRPMSDDVTSCGVTCDDVTASRGLGGGSPEVVRALGDVSLLYVVISIGGVCLMAASLCACAAQLDHFLSAVARGSFLLPVSTYFRSAVEFLLVESRHLNAASMSWVEQGFELSSLQQIIKVFNTGMSTP